MKSKFTTILSVVAVLVTVLCITGPAEASPPARPKLQSGGAPTVVSYQGQVIVDDIPYNGTGYFKFAVVNADGEIYWTNDGTSGSDGEPEGGVLLTVTEGLFNVLLGEIDEPNNMTEPLDAEAFDEPERYLRVWFSTEDEGDYLLLSPDRRIAAVPYALQAEEAANADTVDGEHASAFADAIHIHTPSDIVPQGVGSGLDADLLDGQHGGHYQARVSGVCPSGAISRINSDGTVNCSTTGGICPAGSTLRAVLPGTFECQPDALNRAVAPTANVSTFLDGRNGSAGQYTSITVGKDGLGLISYYGDNGLKVAHCDNPACTSATLNMVESNISLRGNTSIIIGADGLPLISYCDDTNGGLKVAQCGDWTCTSAISTTVSSGGFGVGLYNSVTIGADGLPLISYYDATNGEVRVAHCEDRACTSADHNLIGYTDTEGDGGYNSVTIGVDGLPLITYYQHDHTNQAASLKVAHCDDLMCTTATLNTVGSEIYDVYPGLYNSVTIGVDGLPLISYCYYHWNPALAGYEGYLNVAHCEDPTCDSTLEPVTILDGGTDEVYYYNTSVTIGADGLGLISYYQYDAWNHAGDLKVAHCKDPACTSATLNTVDSIGEYSDDSGYNSVTIGADGLPLISYHDLDDGTLKAFHCGSTFCTPYFRRR